MLIVIAVLLGALLIESIFVAFCLVQLNANVFESSTALSHEVFILRTHAINIENMLTELKTANFTLKPSSVNVYQVLR